MSAYPTLALEMEFSGVGGGWTDVAADVMADGIELQYGIQGAGPLDQVASTGSLRFALANQANAAGLLGYYSPEHTNKRSGFEIGIRARLKLTYAGTSYYKFIGWLDTIEPEAGKWRGRRTHCMAVDWMDVAARFPINIGTQTNTDANSVINLIQAMSRPQPPGGIDLDTGDSTFPYCLDNAQQERTTALSEFVRLLRSEGPPAKLFLRGDTTTGGVLEFQNRSARFSPGAVAATFTDDMVELRVGHRASDLVNRVKAVTHPRSVDAAATTVLYSLPQPQASAIAAGGSLTFTGYYTDPTLRAARVGGLQMVTPASTTDYTMNTGATGGGSDLTANFTVTATYGANSVDYTIANGSTQDGYITKLQARGKGIYDYSPATADRSDTGSIGTYRENVLELDMPYQSDPQVGVTVADLILMVRKVPRPQELEMTFFANLNSTLLTYALSLEPGDAISVNETVTGVGLTFWINSVRMRIVQGGGKPFVWVTYLLELSPSEGYWYLGLTGHSEMGFTTYLG